MLMPQQYPLLITRGIGTWADQASDTPIFPRPLHDSHRHRSRSPL